MVASTAVAKSLKFKDAKWEVAIPWKDERTLPPFKWLENTERKSLRSYSKTIRNYTKQQQSDNGSQL